MNILQRHTVNQIKYHPSRKFNNIFPMQQNYLIFGILKAIFKSYELLPLDAFEKK